MKEAKFLLLLVSVVLAARFTGCKKRDTVDKRRKDGCEASKDRPETLQSVKDTKTDPQTSADQVSSNGTEIPYDDIRVRYLAEVSQKRVTDSLNSCNKMFYYSI